MKTANLTLAIPKSLAEALKEYKKLHFVSISAIAVKLLSDWLEGQIK